MVGRAPGLAFLLDQKLSAPNIGTFLGGTPPAHYQYF
jgi:hypothetical protein